MDFLALIEPAVCGTLRSSGSLFHSWRAAEQEVGSLSSTMLFDMWDKMCLEGFFFLLTPESQDIRYEFCFWRDGRLARWCCILGNVLFTCPHQHQYGTTFRPEGDKRPELLWVAQHGAQLPNAFKDKGFYRIALWSLEWGKNVSCSWLSVKLFLSTMCLCVWMCSHTCLCTMYVTGGSQLRAHSHASLPGIKGYLGCLVYERGTVTACSHHSRAVCDFSNCKRINAWCSLKGNMRVNLSK